MRFLKMISRKDLSPPEVEFIRAAAEEQNTTEDLHKFVKPSKWPISDKILRPSLANGSTKLRKALTIQLKEAEWNSIDRHIKTLNVGKNEWVRYAILKQLQEEQLYFFKKR